MDYEGLWEEVSKQSHHTEHVDADVHVCVLSVLQYRITVIFP